MRSTDRTPVALAPHAEAYTLAALALELDRSADWLEPDTSARSAVDFALNAVRAQLVPIARTLADSPVMSSRDSFRESCWWSCPCCTATDAALMRAVDAFGRAIGDLLNGPLADAPGTNEQAEGLLLHALRIHGLVECPDCRTRTPGCPAPTVLERDSQRRPRRPRAVR